jgi:type I restriction enzyme, S subunit
VIDSNNDTVGYKNTGVPWLEQIPERWNITRSKNLFRKENREVRPDDDVVTCFRDGLVTLRKNRRVTGFTESIKEIGYQGIRKGDLVIHVMDAFAGAIGVANSDGKGSPVYSVCTAKTDLNSKYYAYLLREMARRGYIKALYRGIRERSSDFRFETFGNLLIPSPPKEEQDQIVRYIDSKLVIINKFIRNKKRLIELLKEQKQAVINQAVTKGLDPDVKMKPSGVVWLGNIPEVWEAVKVKWLLLQKKGALKVGPFGSDLKGNDITVDGEVMIFNQRTVIDKNFSANEYKVTQNTYNRLRSFEVFSDDILITTRGTIGKTVIVPKMKHKAILHPCLMRLQVNQNAIKLNYLELLIGESSLFYEQLRFLSNATTIEVIYSGSLKNINLPIPTLQEQKEILNYIRKAIKTIDQTIDRINKEIDLITEYRTCLISAVVTGKVDVRGIEVEDPSTEDLTTLEPAALDGDEPQEDELIGNIESEVG